MDTRIGILKTHQSQETSEANERAEEAVLKGDTNSRVSIFWNQDCFKMVGHGSLRAAVKKFLKAQLTAELCLLHRTVYAFVRYSLLVDKPMVMEIGKKSMPEITTFVILRFACARLHMLSRLTGR